MNNTKWDFVFRLFNLSVKVSWKSSSSAFSTFKFSGKRPESGSGEFLVIVFLTNDEIEIVEK